MTVETPPYALQSASHSAQLFRQAISSLMNSAGGVVDEYDYLVQAQVSPNMSVQVNGGIPGGRAWVPGTTESGIQGLYYVYNDAEVTQTISAASSYNRIDISVLQVEDAAYAGATNTAQLAIVQGSSSGAQPSTPATSLLLAAISVPTGTSSIISSLITDKRPHVGPRNYSYRLVTNSCNVNNNDMLVANGTLTATLPAHAAGQSVLIVNDDGEVTVATSGGSNTIVGPSVEDVSSFIMYGNGGWVRLDDDGSLWHVAAGGVESGGRPIARGTGTGTITTAQAAMLGASSFGNNGGAYDAATGGLVAPTPGFYQLTVMVNAGPLASGNSNEMYAGIGWEQWRASSIVGTTANMVTFPLAGNLATGQSGGMIQDVGFLEAGDQMIPIIQGSSGLGYSVGYDFIATLIKVSD
jgi:hypothetical protein